jgi:hypothetical protein
MNHTVAILVFVDFLVRDLGGRTQSLNEAERRLFVGLAKQQQ